MLGFRDTVIGFRLLGIDGTIIDDIQLDSSINRIKELINDFKKRSESGIIIINEKIMDKMEDFIFDIKKNHEKILIIEIPDRNGPIKPILDLNYIMKNIIGMKI